MQKIIIVEDDEMLSDIYQIKFAKSGFEVLIAVNGKEALEIAKKEKVDIVLSDLKMPEMDGFEMTKKLRSKSYDQSIKLVIFTNLEKEDSLKKLADCGPINGYITKSDFTPTELVEEVRRMVA